MQVRRGKKRASITSTSDSTEEQRSILQPRIDDIQAISKRFTAEERAELLLARESKYSVQVIVVRQLLEEVVLARGQAGSPAARVIQIILKPFWTLHKYCICTRSNYVQR